jgi:hypothetical protein
MNNEKINSMESELDASLTYMQRHLLPNMPATNTRLERQIKEAKGDITILTLNGVDVSNYESRLNKMTEKYKK